MNRRSWLILLIIVIVLIIILIIAYCCYNPSVKTTVENFIENVADKGIISLMEEYSGEKIKKTNEKRDVTVNNNSLEERVNIEVPEVPDAFLRDTRAVSGDFVDFESSGTKRTKPERLCKKVLERIYRRKFTRIRPTWLRNPKTGRSLELDCYNEELGIALEYNGIAHYKWPNWTGMSKEEFLAQAERDRYKLDACDARGIYLIVVPYNIPEKLIPDFIEYQLPHNVQRRREIQSGSSYA